MESIGARLREIRLKKGLSLEEAHAKTKLNLTILKAIEEDNLANVSPVYIKGFIKIYCEFLGVTPEDHAPDSQPSQTSASTPKAKEQLGTPRTPEKVKIPSFRFQLDTKIWVAIGVIVLVGLFLFGLKKMQRRAGNATRIPAQQQTRAKKQTPFKPSPKKTTQKPIPAYQLPGATKTVLVPSQKVSQMAQAPKSESSVAPPLPKVESVSGIRLGIHAREDCWVQLKIDGKAVFQNVLRKGRYEVWQAKDKMELSLGNVGSVELELNGKMLQSLGRKGQSLKNMVITKEGLKVER